MTDEPPRTPNGTRLPFTRSAVPPLNEWDHRHFLGADGTGGGAHVAGYGRERATEFPAWVHSLDDLQRVHDAVLAAPARVQRGAWGRYEIRAYIELGGTGMVVHVVLEEDGTPVTLYPINGDFVVRNIGGRRVPQPLDGRALLPW